MLHMNAPSCPAARPGRSSSEPLESRQRVSRRKPQLVYVHLQVLLWFISI